ncbi:MAG: 4-hydroxy-3-methylbut-2-enyl diphosphate reductase [Acidobacteria bacterium]|nr:4-hydroxy-3-methylbut-2-enyl diphosphate reductase [Acidobacteriota bacterium]
MADETQVVRKGFGLREQVAGQLADDYHCDLVDRARAQDYRLAWPGLDVRIAREFGFCYGVERAIDYAYEARRRFPDRRLLLTGEIIHNPRVNARLREIGYEFLDGSYGSRAEVADLGPDDVVLIPAFGVSVGQFDQLKSTGALLVDTTCGSVLNVWRNVERYAKDRFTCLIHGKWNHEETRATASRTSVYPGARYLIVRDMAEAEMVARYIEDGGDGAAFLEQFRQACSPGFDPQRDLERVGMANQTTMLSSESLAIAERIRLAISRRHGEAEAAQRFRSFDTICSATEDRQQAVIAMLQDPPDLVIIIGGFNSSNTGHLTEICAAKVPTYHIEDASHLVDAGTILHKPPHAEPLRSSGWLPAGPLRIGITAGASTPDREIGRVIARLLELRGIEDRPEIS